MTKAVLVTGSAGFIGFHLCQAYLEQGFTVIGVDNYLTGSKDNTLLLKEKFSDRFIFFDHDICKPWSFLGVIHKYSVQYVFHLASAAAVNQYQQHALETMWANSTGLGFALQAADNLKAKLIFSSTSEIYGSASISPQNENYWGSVNSFGDRSCYDESKRFGESLIYTWNKKNNTRHGLVRIFNTYGPRMNSLDGRVVIQLLRQALTNEDLTIYGDGKQTRSFCYIDDLVRGLINYAESNLSQPINLGRQEEVEINQLAKLILEITKSKSKIKYLSLPSDDPPQRIPDLSLAKSLLNYESKISLQDGIQKLIAEIVVK